MDLPKLDGSISNEDQKSNICGATLPYSRSCQKSYSRTKLPKNSTVFSSTLHKQSSQVFILLYYVIICFVLLAILMNIFLFV